LSDYTQRKQGFTVSRLYRADEMQIAWKEIPVEDPNRTPAELAESRMDLGAWLRGVSRRRRRIAAALTSGATTREAARQFTLTTGRIAELQRELPKCGVNPSPSRNARHPRPDKPQMIQHSPLLSSRVGASLASARTQTLLRQIGGLCQEHVSLRIALERSVSLD
jgi:hypothetical protein